MSVRGMSEARCLRIYGCSPDILDQLKALHPNERKSPPGRYVRHKCDAKRRGIKWQITLPEWWAIWKASGRFEQRGIGAGHYVMCRKGDVGPYAPDNVFIALAVENSAYTPQKKYPLPIGVGIGWSGKYVAQRCRKGRQRYLGTFDTPEEAHAAYLAAGEPQAVELKRAA